MPRGSPERPIRVALSFTNREQVIGALLGGAGIKINVSRFFVYSSLLNFF